MKPKFSKVLIIFFAILLLLGTYLLMGKKAPQIDENLILPQAKIDYPSQFNYLQTPNDCGPFNAAAVVRSLTGEQVSSAKFANDIGWRLPNNYTFPLGMELLLQDNGIELEIPNIKALSDTQKVQFLQERLSQNKPIIILGERDGYEHYLTIFGYNKLDDEFYIYDSLFDSAGSGLTIDENGDLPGNRNLNSEALLAFWSGSGMYGFYTWYAIVAG